ncbi:MAG: ABC transporter permease [Ktedonobacterales bacterium]
MSATYTPTYAPAAPATSARTLRPSFIGLVRGELLKLSRQWSLYIMLVLLAGLICLPFLLFTQRSGYKVELQNAPLQILYRGLGSGMLVLRVFSGVILAILTARLIGMEYSGGTIRVTLARGVGRLQFLYAKLAAMALVALGMLIGGAALMLLVTGFTSLITLGNFSAFNAANADFWTDAWTYTSIVALSMGVTILMATAVTVIGRSLAFGVAVSAVFFAADNIGTVFFLLAYLLTKNNFWTLATGDLLGPNINSMAGLFLPQRAASAVFIGAFPTPLVPVTGQHTLIITGVWTVIFVAVALVLTWRRDVKE